MVKDTWVENKEFLTCGWCQTLQKRVKISVITDQETKEQRLDVVCENCYYKETC